ncbi:MAG: hypothetical protein ACPL7B_14440 [Candidatus Poribacteria bacterium]
MLKASVVILVVMLAFAAIYSLTALITPKAVLKSTINASIGKTLDEAQSAGYLRAITIVMRHLGGIALAQIIAGFFILFAGFRKAQKWAWFGLLIAGCVGWLIGVIVNIVIGDMTNLTLHIIGFVIFLVGVLLPVKHFFVKAQ